MSCIITYIYIALRWYPRTDSLRIMEQRTKRDLVLENIILDFENKFKQGEVSYMEEKTLHQLVDYYDNQMQFDKALEVVDLAIEQYKYRCEFLIIKSKLLFNTGLVEDCLSLLEKAERISPYEIEIQILKSKAFAFMKRYDEALAIVEDLKTYAQGPDLIETYMTEAFVFEVMNEVGLVYNVLKKVLKHDGSHENALKSILNAGMCLRKINESIDLHERLLDENPYNYMAWYNLGHFYSYINEYSNAADAFEYALIINPNFQEAYMECAEEYLFMNEYGKALKIYKEATQIFEGDPDTLLNMAKCQLALNLFAEAEESLLEALKYDQYNDEVYFILAETYSKVKNWYSAINAYQKALAIEDEREDYYVGIAKAYFAIEDFAKATLNFQLATEVNDSESYVWKEYVCFILKLGLYQEAVQILDEAEEYTYGPDLLYCRAAAFFFMKKKKKGLKVLEEALIEDFESNNILFELAPELEVDKDIAAMVKYYSIED